MRKPGIDNARLHSALAREISTLIEKDAQRMEALHVARKLNLPQWLLAAGFVRNCIWDHLHGYPVPSPLSDIDLIYYNPQVCCEDLEQRYERQLSNELPLPWSVKNQARMHVKNNDSPYGSTLDAMRYWVEVETAMGVFLDEHDRIQLVSAFPLPDSLEPTVTINPFRPKPVDFEGRIQTKGWQELWPALRVSGAQELQTN